MNATIDTPLSQRDRAVLQAVAAGRCMISETFGGNLVIDGVWCADQFAGSRLTEAGLIIAGPHGGPARLTGSGRALLRTGGELLLCGHHARKHGPRLRDIGAVLNPGP